MRRTFWRSCLAVAAAVAALVSAGCSAGSGSAAPAGLEKTNLLVAAVPTMDSAGLYIAEQRGLFAAEGLHVKIVPAISGATTIAGQLSGKYDVTVGNYVSYVLQDALHHSGLCVLAAGSVMGPNSQVLVVPAGSPITSVSQLRGKAIGVNVLNNIGTLLLSSLLNDNGMSVSDVHFRPIEFPDMASALQKHEVDAAWLPEPFLTGAEETIGAQPLADLDQGTTQNFPISGYIVTRTWLREYPHTAAAFRAAIEKAQTIADSNLSAVEDSMVAYTPVKRQTVTIVQPPGFPTQTDPRSIQRVSDLMFQFGMLTQAFDVKVMMP